MHQFIQCLVLDQLNEDKTPIIALNVHQEVNNPLRIDHDYAGITFEIGINTYTVKKIHCF